MHSSSSRVTLPALPIDFRFLDAEDAATNVETASPALADVNEVLLSVDIKGKDALGCAYYEAENQALYLLNDIQSAELGLLNSLLIQVQPTMVLLSVKAPEAVIEYLEERSRSDENRMSPPVPIFPPYTC